MAMTDEEFGKQLQADLDEMLVGTTISRDQVLSTYLSWAEEWGEDEANEDLTPNQVILAAFCYGAVRGVKHMINCYALVDGIKLGELLSKLKELVDGPEETGDAGASDQSISADVAG